MNTTTSETSKKTEVGTKVTKTVIDYAAAVPDETPSMFEQRAFKAELHGIKSIEANDAILAYYNPQGLGHSNFFNYRKLVVFKEGTKAAAEEAAKLQSQQLNLGEKYFFEGNPI